MGETIEDPRWYVNLGVGTSTNWVRMSEEAERIIEERSNGETRLTIGRRVYVYDHMTQTNEETGTVRAIKREVVRMKLLSDTLKFGTVIEKSADAAAAIPALAFWDAAAPRHNGSNYARIPVVRGTEEWAFIESRASGTAFALAAAWRIQNNLQAMQHLHKVDEMQDARGVKVHARQLFHGTGNGSIHAICDSSVGIGAANVYGSGVSHTHQVPGTDLLSVLLVNVLLDERCVGVPTTTDDAVRVMYRENQALVTHVLFLRQAAPSAPTAALVPAPAVALVPALATSQSSVVVGARVRMLVKGYGVHEGTVENVNREKRKCDILWDDNTKSRQSLTRCTACLI
jgi:hypothetical protein